MIMINKNQLLKNTLKIRNRFRCFQEWHNSFQNGLSYDVDKKKKKSKFFKKKYFQCYYHYYFLSELRSDFLMCLAIVYFMFIRYYDLNCFETDLSGALNTHTHERESQRDKQR